MNTLDTVRQIYRETENEAVRGAMETTLAWILRQRRERKRQREERELLNCFKACRRDYANRCSAYTGLELTEAVHDKIGVALPGMYQKLAERGMEACIED